MFPIMCIQPACMNRAVTMVIKCRPATISAGITDHCFTNSSPPISSNTKTSAFTTMIAVVTTGKLLGRRDASDNGIIPPHAVFLRFSGYTASADAGVNLLFIRTLAPDSDGSIFGSAVLRIQPFFEGAFNFSRARTAFFSSTLTFA